MPDYVIITGASSGIGKELAIYMTERGYHVIGLGRNLTVLQELASTAQSKEQTFIPMAADFKNENYLNNLLEYLQTNPQNTIKYMIHCAAMFEPFPLLSQTHSLQDHMNVNALHPLEMTKRLRYPYYNNETRILFLGSDFFGTNKMKPNVSGAYAVSKTTLITSVNYLREECYPDLLIGCLNPGSTDTPLYANFITSLNLPSNVVSFSKPNSPKDIAIFIVQVLTNSANHSFVKTDWDYRNNDQHFEVAEKSLLEKAM